MKPDRQRALLAILVLGIAVGVRAGIGGYTFVYARGGSYLTNDPRACANCHVMNEQYDAWEKGRHHHVAVCNDCHTPHNLIGKYATKGLNGWHHSWAFTSGDFHEPIQITKRNRKITEQTCRDCHGEIVQQIDHHSAGSQAISCIRCHRDVGHAH
jgi:cytochrome c nitrite reductase small subunit